MGLNTSIYKNADLDETKRQVKAGQTEVFGWHFFNDSTGSIFVRFYNALAANVTVGTTVPALTIGVPAGGHCTIEFTNPIEFGTGLTVAATTSPADSDTTAPGNNELQANLFYR